MSPQQAWQILDDDSGAFAEAIVGRKADRDEYAIEIFRPGNSAELYLAQQTLLMDYERIQKELSILKGVNTDGQSKGYSIAS